LEATIKLKSQVTTILLVTNDATVAAQTKLTINIQDGVIVEAEKSL